MITAVQVISKVLNTKDYTLISNNLDESHFIGYEAEYNYIKEHYSKYKQVPDRETFISKFNNFNLIEVEETNQCLVDKIREEKLYRDMVPILQQGANLISQDSDKGLEYLKSMLSQLHNTYSIGGIDIIRDAKERYDNYIDRRDNQDKWYFTTGFKELDDVIYGIQREEELVVLFARTNQGKSWVLEKILTHIWSIGFNVGYISPEMGATSIGFRFDTLYKHFSNRDLICGAGDKDEYNSYVNSLSGNKFIVSTPLDFDKNITISNIRRWVEQNELQCIAVDGITYLQDERGKKGDNKTTTLTNISEDLMELSMELKIPILVVVQSNRTGVKTDKEKGTPELDSIRDSDGISHNASKVLSLRQKDGTLEIGIKKQRFGSVGGSLIYQWDIDKGNFTFIPSINDAEKEEVTVKKIDELKQQFKSSEDIF